MKNNKDKEVIGICPLCSGNIYQGRTKTGKVNYYCEKYKEGCKFTLWENIKYYKEELKITKDKAKALLKKNGKAKFKINNKEETLKIEIKNYQGNTYINLKKILNIKYGITILKGRKRVSKRNSLVALVQVPKGHRRLKGSRGTLAR